MLEGLTRAVCVRSSLASLHQSVVVRKHGAFLRPDSILRFGRFTRKVVESLGDLCSDWPPSMSRTFTRLGVNWESFPPGRKGRLISSLRALANMARAHALAYDAIHELQPGANAGWTQNYIVFQAVKDRSPFNRIACGIQS